MGKYMKRYTPYFIIALLASVLLFQCEKHNNLKNITAQNNNALQDSVKYYKNKLGTTTASIQTLQMTQEQLEHELTNKNAKLAALTSEYNKIKNVTHFKNKTIIDSVVIVFNEPVVFNDDKRKGMFERTGTKFTDWYSLGYKVNNKGIVIEPFSTWTATTVVTGFKRKWFLGKQTLVTNITNSNPYITVTDIKATEVVIPEPWYKKWYIWLTAGFMTGTLLE